MFSTKEVIFFIICKCQLTISSCHRPIKLPTLVCISQVEKYWNYNNQNPRDIFKLFIMKSLLELLTRKYRNQIYQISVQINHFFADCLEVFIGLFLKSSTVCLCTVPFHSWYFLLVSLVLILSTLFQLNYYLVFFQVHT